MDMSFEAQVALQRLVVPSLVASVGAFFLSRYSLSADSLGNGLPGDGPLGKRPMLRRVVSTLCGCILIGAAMVVSDLWQRGILLEPSNWKTWSAREPWMWMVWLVPASVLVLWATRTAAGSAQRCAAWSWPVFVSAAVGVLVVALPRGPGYENLDSQALLWLAAASVASVWNAAALNRVARAPGGRWSPLLVLAQLGCVAALVLQSYASLGEWVLAGIGVAVGVSLISLLTAAPPSPDFGWGLAPPVHSLGILANASLAVSTFYELNPQPLWLLGCILLLPTWVVLVDSLLGFKSPWARAALAAVLSAILLGVVIGLAMQNALEW